MSEVAFGVSGLEAHRASMAISMGAQDTATGNGPGPIDSSVISSSLAGLLTICSDPKTVWTHHERLHVLLKLAPADRCSSANSRRFLSRFPQTEESARH